MSTEEALKKWIEDTYGSPEKLAQVLDSVIEMLFYLEENTFEKREVQDVVSTLRGIVNEIRVDTSIISSAMRNLTG
ncbi:hypothetical protein ACOKFD_08260 [Flagellimonas sp. S174]|uniref:hypothetical protein n=1 Tax=Flagellimonas sp. S174 TaxID=3410790 RepID=UPI003BF4DA58